MRKKDLFIYLFLRHRITGHCHLIQISILLNPNSSIGRSCRELNNGDNLCFIIGDAPISVSETLFWVSEENDAVSWVLNLSSKPEALLS